MFKIAELVKATRGALVSGAGGESVKGISTDSRSARRGDAFIAIRGDRFDGHDFIGAVIKKGVKCIIGEKEQKIKGAVFIKVKDTLRALGDIAGYNRERHKDIPLIAVSGSCGKTTAKEMIAQVLGKKFKVLKNAGTLNNHIGLPLTLLKLNSAYDLAVVEIGTNHFGEVSYLGRIARPDIGVITNIGPGHLAYFRDLRGVFREKYDLINSLRGPSIAVLNADDEFLRKEILKKKICPFILGVGIKNRGDFRATDIRYVSGKPVFRVNRRFKFALKTLGYYNVYNALSAIAVARIFGMEYRDIASALAAFDPPANRLNLREINGIRFIDDSYNSNPLSMKQALGVLRALPGKGRRILVMGDMLELGAGALALHEGIIKEALAFVDTLITVGPLTRSCASKAARQDRVYTCETSSEAREVLFKTARVDPRDVILVKGSRGMKMEEVLKI